MARRQSPTRRNEFDIEPVHLTGCGLMDSRDRYLRRIVAYKVASTTWQISLEPQA